MKLSGTTRYLVVICAFLFSINSILGYVLTKQSGTAMRTLIENRMLDISNTAAAMLDGDELEKLEAQDEDKPEYQKILKTLSYFQDNINLEYIYCIRDLGNKHFVFMIDPSDSPGEFGEPVVFTDALYQASQGRPSVDKVPYTDRWGRFYSAYTPVFGSGHRVTGIVAVDFSASWYENQIGRQYKTVLLVSGLSLFFACLIVLVIAADFNRKFRSMVREMNAVSEGIEKLVQEAAPGGDSSLYEDLPAQPQQGQGAAAADARGGTGSEKDPEAGRTIRGDGISELGGRIRLLEDQLSRRITFVRAQAFVDGLTGLGNRAAYEEHVRLLEEEIKEGKADFSVAVFDINGLKELNDLHGHEKGDQAILQAASVLKRCFGEAKIYRIGGDEFLVLFDSSDLNADALFHNVDELLDKNKEISLAKGYAGYDPVYDMGYRVVFNRADYAMYNDKREYYLTHKDRRRGKT